MAGDSALSMKGKLVALQMLVVFVVLVMAGSIGLVLSLRQERALIEAEAESMARLLGSNSASALDFLDRRTAREVLASVEAVDSVAQAWLLDERGQLFASYRRDDPDGEASIPDEADGDGRTLIVSRPIIEHGATLGTIGLAIDLDEHRRAVRTAVLASLVLLTVAMACAYGLAVQGQRMITTPISALVAAVRQVKDQGDFAVRVERTTDDEIGVLADEFNRTMEWMLRLQQRRDQAEQALQQSQAELQRHRDQLEELVRQRTAELEEQRNRFQHLTTHLPAMVYEGKSFPDGKVLFTYLSPQLRATYGVDAEDPETATEELFARIHPGDRDQVMESNRRAIERCSSWHGVHRIVTPGGDTVWVEGAANPTRQSDGSVVWDGLILDITDRKLAEEALEQARNELEQRVIERTADLANAITLLEGEVAERLQAEEELKRHRHHLEELVSERTRELAVAKDRAEAADRLKSAFLATMSHELRTPLNSIIGFTGILLKGLAGPLNEEQRTQLAMVQRSARHLHALINDVLDISKIEAGQLRCRFAPFSMADVIARVVHSVRPMATAKELELEVEVAPEVGSIESDRRRVEQILLNLVNNAIKFTDDGGARIWCRHEDGHLVTTVSDTGIGIAEEDLETLFEPFRQVDTGLSRQREGTGLGLSICRRLLDLLGGTITAQSRPGVGSSFTFTLPLIPPADRSGE